MEGQTEECPNLRFLTIKIIGGDRIVAWPSGHAPSRGGSLCCADKFFFLKNLRTRVLITIIPLLNRALKALFSNGRGERIRTSGLLLPKQARYQAALRPDTGKVTGYNEVIGFEQVGFLG